MAEINVKPKKNNSWRIVVLVILAAFLLWWFFVRKEQLIVTRLSPIADSTTGMEDTTILDNNISAPMRDTREGIQDGR